MLHGVLVPIHSSNVGREIVPSWCRNSGPITCLQDGHLWKAPKVKSCLSHLRKKVPLQKHLIPGQKICLHIEVGRNVCWKKSNAMLVSQTQYPAGQSGKKRRHCTTLITQICFSSTVIQMQGNNLTGEAEGHPTEHDGNSLKLLQGNMSPRQGTWPGTTNR